MTEQEQQIALCEWMGYRYQEGEEPVYGGSYKARGWFTPEGSSMKFVKELPNTNSLDVLHGMEMKLDEDQKFNYARILFHFRHGFTSNIVGLSEMPIMATASQRREALLRTLGLWKD